MSKQKPKVIERLGSKYVVLRERKTIQEFKELLVRQLTPIEMSNIFYLIDYR